MNIYPHLSKPIQVGKYLYKHRIIASPLGRGRFLPDGNPNPRTRYLAEARAKGGFAEIPIGETSIDFVHANRENEAGSDYSKMEKEPSFKAFSAYAKAIRDNGAIALCELSHCGRERAKLDVGFPIGPVSYTRADRVEVVGMDRSLMDEVCENFATAAEFMQKAGFQGVLVLAAHGWLMNQFLSPCMNTRKDEYGGSLENRMRFMDEVMDEVMKAAGSDMAVLVKMNMRDGFKGGMDIDESLEVAQRLKDDGAHALVLSGGFVSKAPMYVMRGAMPIKTLTHYMDCWWLKYGVRLFGRLMIPTVPFKEAYFLDDAMLFRDKIKDIPLVYVGGLVSREKIDEVLNKGFDFVQMGRALLNEPGFVNRMKMEECARCNCGHSNYCIGRMYTVDMACHQHLDEELPPCLKKEIEKLENK